MKKFLAILFLYISLFKSAYADSTTTFKCNLDRGNYEYTINLYNKKLNDVRIKNIETKETYYYDNLLILLLF